MDQAGLINSVFTGASHIELGRKGFATKGKEREGRISYEDGISMTQSAFEEVRNISDPEIIILAEYTFISQELQFCGKADTDTFSSLTQAILSFDDAFLALEAVEDLTGYKVADKTYSHSPRYRIQGFPKDIFHIACIAHRTRLQNILRSPGIDPIEKALLKQRFANMTAAQGKYIEKQKKALGIPPP